MFALSRVSVFEERLTVKICKAVGILREMSRNPVQDDTDPLFMHIVYEIFELLRSTIAGGGSIVAGYLVAPGAIVGMLGNSHQLYVGIAHFFDVGGQFRCRLLIGIVAVLFRAVFLFPGAQVNLIDTHGSFTRIGTFAFLNPGCVAPTEGVVPGRDGSGARAVLGILGKGICLENDLSGLRGNGKFVKLTRLDVRDELLVDAGGLQQMHGAGIRIPVVEIPYNTDFCCMRSPYCKIITFFAVKGHRVCTKLIVDFIVGAFAEQVTVTGGNEAGFCVLFLISDCHKVNPP